MFFGLYERGFKVKPWYVYNFVTGGDGGGGLYGVLWYAYQMDRTVDMLNPILALVFALYLSTCLIVGYTVIRTYLGTWKRTERTYDGTTLGREALRISPNLFEVRQATTNSENAGMSARIPPAGRLKAAQGYVRPLLRP